MDDLFIRRSILTDPKFRDDAINSAINEDPAKQKFVHEVEALDEKITQALNIPVPDDLAHKLILRQTLANHQQQKRKTRMQFAMAASVTFILGLSINFMMFSSTYKNLGDYAIAHVDYESAQFSNTDQANVTLASLNEKMTTFNGHFDSTFGTLISADYCYFDGSKSLHLVFKGKSNPVNVFILPNDESMKFNASFSNERLEGRSLNFNNSNVVIVGDKKEPLNDWQERLNNTVTWSI